MEGGKRRRQNDVGDDMIIHVVQLDSKDLFTVVIGPRSSYLFITRKVSCIG